MYVMAQVCPGALVPGERVSSPKIVDIWPYVFVHKVPYNVLNLSC